MWPQLEQRELESQGLSLRVQLAADVIKDRSGVATWTFWSRSLEGFLSTLISKYSLSAANFMERKGFNTAETLAACSKYEPV